MRENFDSGEPFSQIRLEVSFMCSTQMFSRLDDRVVIGRKWVQPTILCELKVQVHVVECVRVQKRDFGAGSLIHGRGYFSQSSGEYSVASISWRYSHVKGSGV